MTEYGHISAKHNLEIGGQALKDGWYFSDEYKSYS